jgi:hypothetical protein
MASPRQLPPASATRRLFLLLTLALLLVNGSAVNAQDNVNGANLNINSTNPSTTRTPAGTTGGSTNINQNGNNNQRASGPSTAESPSPAEEARRNKLADSYWYFTIVTMMFVLLLLPFGYTIVRAIRFSRATFNSPLGLPEGSLRAILAYTLLAYLGFYILASVLSISDVRPPDFLLGIIATVIGFYFGSRTGEERAAGSASSRNGAVEGKVVGAAEGSAVGASVRLSQAGAVKFTQIADAGGKYKFDNVPPGDYDIQASTATATSDPAKVKVTAGATQTVPDLKLK